MPTTCPRPEGKEGEPHLETYTRQANIAELIARCARQGHRLYTNGCTLTALLTCLCMTKRNNEKGNDKITTRHLLRYFLFSELGAWRNLSGRYRDRFIARTRGQRRTLSFITADVQEERNNGWRNACLLRSIIPRACARFIAETRCIIASSN